MHLCFFEDLQFKKFFPLVLTRPVDDLRVGILTMREKWERALDTQKTTRMIRAELAEVFKPNTGKLPGTVYWLNSRYLPTPSLLEQVDDMVAGTCLMEGKVPVAAAVDAKKSETWLRSNEFEFQSLTAVQTKGHSSIKNIWDLFALNGTEIARDIERLGSPNSNRVQRSKHAVLEDPRRVFVDEGAVIEANVIINTENGPVYIGKNARVMAGSLIRGPVAVCDNSVVKMGAKIYKDTTIGPVCKVGGEINNSILHSYSNKAHDGFLGNSLIGQWCNIGADTNTSNLKNNYGTVRITDWETEQEVDSGRLFLGAIIGDHTKTAINTQLNTGTICGVSCNIFAGDFPPKFIRSFSWVGSTVIQPYRLDKALETMEQVMKRRDVELTGPYKKLMEHIFKQNRPQ